VSILRIPYSYLSSFIILFCLIGAYSLNNNIVGRLLPHERGPLFQKVGKKNDFFQILQLGPA